MSKTKAELIDENKRLKEDVKELIETASLTTDNLNFYAKERSKLKNEVDQLNKKPKQRIEIREQTHWRKSRQDAKEMVRKLLDAGIWYFSVHVEE